MLLTQGSIPSRLRAHCSLSETVKSNLTTRQKHRRECYVVVEEGADKERIRHEIVNMPNYFSDYDTTVSFITREELLGNHSEMPHGGVVIRSGKPARNPTAMSLSTG